MGGKCKIRWIKQRDNHSCVPVAILNILKWAGASVNRKADLNYWGEEVNHSPDGSHIRDYSAVFSKIPNVRLTRKTRPSLDDIDDALSKGNAVLLRSAWEMNGEIHRHLVLITGRTEKSFFLTNTFRGHAWFAKRLVKAWYMEEHNIRSGIYPTAWLIRKVAS